MSYQMRFGPFCLLPDSGLLLRHDEPVRLGSRAAEILVLLVSNAGDLVTKADIIDKIWPDTIVVEANLSVHMSALRRALDDDSVSTPYIVTVPGRGYRFVAPVIVESNSAPHAGTDSDRPSNLPLLMTRLIGRSDIIDSLRSKLPTQRLTTIVGTGGVGKTALALNVAEQELSRWQDGVWIVDFAALTDATLVPSAVATVLGLEVRSSNPMPAIISALSEKQMLLLFDNCEHVIEAVATIAYGILQSARSVSILATSREPMTIPIETVLRLEPLGVPPEHELVGAREALHYSAIQLLCERARSVDGEFTLADDDALAASLICRKLGGVPLAIEFASALVPIFGLKGLSTRLDDRLRLLSDGHRNVLPRHRTLTAALDWSYQLLDQQDQRIFRQLAVFSGGFTIEAAAAVAGVGEDTVVAEIIARLVRKSLVTPDLRNSRLRFRLLETTRAFAIGALDRAGDTLEANRRHAEYFARALHGAGEFAPASENHVPFVLELDNIRAALRWATSPEGDIAVALAIGAGALPIWFGLSLLTECGTRMNALMEGLDPALRESPYGAAIDIAIQATEIFTVGARDTSYQDWTERQQSAMDRDQLLERVRLLLGRWTYNIRMPDYALADQQARELESLALLTDIANPDDVPLAFLVDRAHLGATASWARGTTVHHIGDLAAARDYLQKFLVEETPAMRAFFMTITGFDRRSDVYGLLSIAKCLQGDVAEGLADAETAITEARSTKKALPICEALQWSCFTMLLMNQPVAVVTPLVDEMMNTAKNHSLFSHYGVALCLKGCLAAASGRHESAVDRLKAGLSQLESAHYGPFDPFFVGVVATSLMTLGRITEARDSVSEFEQRRVTHNGFCGPEYSRRKALLSVLSGNPAAAEAELRAAREEAVRQGAQLWHLRAGSDLAAFYEGRQRTSEARQARDDLERLVSSELVAQDIAVRW
ncbi:MULTISPECIES: winged helix-turn-helix domain-containing protein [unclassified Novosphingobium]|uniref:ATP-binding protein n=1 Tax=unclassified Novosphingobium TaxID=2644732 RepID=UPI00146C344B|nr:MULTISPECIES: winged helix-turn-helix domain-containing protein [unclassified Novosphingobium]NMN06839.1 putative ATPase/DNA-binding winged helix-turn-helix (wHTH) protein [Novosphingobium sp. SG919]NMN88711.1 putative ATPase/DNA-binding winged helix-turn-helix (wHTH) protein [Novosphingobium sp. SG916]